MRHAADDLPPEDRRMLENIEGHGLHVVHAATAAFGGEPIEYAHSVGLWHHFEQPEVIVFGLPANVATELLEAIADEASEGRPCAAGSERADLLEGYRVRFLAVPPHQRDALLRRARVAYGERPFDVVQLVWPDRQGRWPWQDAAHAGARALQPLLDRVAPPGEAAPASPDDDA